MKKIVGLGLIALLPGFVAFAQVQTEKPPIALSEAQEHRFKTLLPDLRCLVCQNESLADSQAPLALDLRYEIRDLLAHGDSDAQIKRYLTDRYGEFILYKPQVEPKTWLLWFGPLLLVAIGLILLLRQSRRPIVTASQTVDSAALKRLLDEDRP